MINSSYLRYGKLFSYFRQLVKHFLSASYPFIKLIYTFPKVESVFETLTKLQNDSSLSLVRFGDGEIIYINDKMNLPFQQYDSRLADAFKLLFKNDHSKLLIGLPIGYHDITTMSKEGQIFWRSQIVWNYPRFQKYFDTDSL